MITSLVVSTVLSVGIVFSPHQTITPHLERRSVESILQKQCTSMKAHGDSICYEAGGGVFAIVAYDGQGVVKKITLTSFCDDHLFKRVEAVASKLVPAEIRGKNKRGTPPVTSSEATSGPLYYCRESRVEEYENVVMSYESDNCANCPHSSITITSASLP